MVRWQDPQPRQDRMRGTNSLALTTAAALCVAISCRRTAPEEQEPLIRRPVWYNFYRRGVWRSRHSEWAGALSDFETVLGIRKGAQYPDGRERRRAKTYGLRFLNDYFPQRERGVCLYQLGELAEAEQELGESLRQLPSGRAKYFLNLVRRRQLQQEGAADPPRIEFEMDAPAGVWYVNTPAIELRGRIRSPHRISRVVVNGVRQFVELAEEAYELKREVRPGSGEKELTVQASDLLGRESVWRKRVVVDLRGPAISVSRSVGPDGVRARVEISDNVGLTSVTLDGEPRVVERDTRETTLDVPVGKGTRVEVEARDAAGNTTAFELKGDELARSFRESLERYPDRQLAWAGGAARTPCVAEQPAERSRRASPSHLLEAHDVRGGSTRRLRVLADAGRLLPLPALASAKAADTMPPMLKLDPEVDGSVRVTSTSYLVDVEVSDRGGFLDSVVFAVNGAEQPVDLRGKEVTLRRMTERFELLEGENVLEIRAKDRAGNEKVRRFEVVRVPEARRSPKLRMTACVLPPEDGGPEELRRVDFHTLLTDALGEDERLNLVEREPEVADWILLERKLSSSRLVDAKRALRAGKITPSEWLLATGVSVWSKGAGYELVCRVVEVETTRTLLTVDVYLATADREHVRYQVGGFAEKLRQKLPVRSAAVASVSKDGVKIPLGARTASRTGCGSCSSRPGASFPSRPSTRADGSRER